MNLIALDFATIALLLIGLVLIGIGNRVSWALAHVSERLIIFVAQSGMPGLARAWLSILVGYDQHLYRKSRFEFRNQVAYRFAILWGCALFALVVLFVLKDKHVVSSISQTWIILTTCYLGFRCLLHWNRPRESTQGRVENQHVKEQTKPASWQGPQLIRRWDYLDELFAEMP